MHRHIMALILGSLLAIGVSSANAYTVGSRTIEVIHLNSGSGIYFKTNEAMVNPDSCTLTSLYHINRNSQYEKEIYALLLAAYTTGTKITFWLDGCDADYPKVIWVKTEPGTL